MEKWLRNTRRLLTGLLSVAMIVTALPSYAFAQEVPEEYAEEPIILSEAPEEAEEQVVPSEEQEEAEEQAVLSEEPGAPEETEEQVALPEEPEEFVDADSDADEKLGTTTYTLTFDKATAGIGQIDVFDDAVNVDVTNDNGSVTVSVTEAADVTTTVFFQITLDPGYILDSVTEQTGTEQPVAVFREGDTFAVMADANKTITIRAKEITYQLPVTMANATLEWAEDSENLGTEDNKSHIITAQSADKEITMEYNEDLYFVVNPASGYMVKSVTAVMENEADNMLLTPEEGQYYQLAKEKVAVCKGIKVETVKSHIVTFKVPEGITIHAYTPLIKKEDGTKEEDTDVIGGAIASAEVEHGSKLAFHVDFDNSLDEAANALVVKQGTKTLEEQIDYYSSEPDGELNEKSGSYYITDSGVKANATITVTLKKKSVKQNDSFVLDLSEAEHATFKTANATTTDGKKYIFKKGATDLNFTVTVPVKYSLQVKNCVMDEDGTIFEDTGLDITGPASLDKTYTNRIYTVSIPAVLAAGQAIVIKEEDASTEAYLDIQYDGNLLAKPVARSGGRYLAPAYDSGYSAVYHAPLYQTVTIETGIRDDVEGYRISKVTLNEEEVPAAVKNGTLSFLPTSDDYYIEYSVSPFPILILSDDDDSETLDNNAKVTLDSKASKELRVKNGDDDLKISDLQVMQGGKPLAGFATPNEEADMLTINASVAAKTGNKPVIVSFKAGDSTWKINFTVEQEITSVVPKKGFKKVKGSDNTYEGTQVNGTSVSYALNVQPKGADLSLIEATASSPYAEASIDCDAGLLEINTFSEPDEGVFVFPKEAFTVTISDASDSAVVYATLNVTPVPATIVAPTVKVMQSTDTYLDLSLALPKAVRGFDNLYYRIHAKATGTHVDGMLNEVTEYVGGYADEKRLYLSEDTDLGQGHAQTYELTIDVIQVYDDTREEWSDEPGGLFASDNICAEGKDKVLKNQKTKDPYYESKLTLKKETTAVTIRDYYVTLATVKFSASTSYAAIGSARLYDPYGIPIEDDVLGWDYGGTKIWLNDWVSEMEYPGTYMLYVWPETPDGIYSAPATMPITFKPAVTDVGFTVPATRLYKAENKPASLKITANPYAVYTNPLNGDDETFKPANSKLEWSISSDNEDLKAALSIKNGVISVAKDYVLAADPDENEFTVKAYSTDLNNEFDVGYFRVSAELQTPATMTINGIKGVAKQPTAYYSNEFDGETLYIVDTEGNDVDWANMTVTVSPKEGFTIDPEDGSVEVTKAGVYTVTAAMNDGSKKTLSLQFAVKNDSIDYYDFTFIGFSGVSYEALSLNPDTENTIDGAQLIMVVARPIGENYSVCENTSVVKIKSGAQNVNAAGYNQLGFAAGAYLTAMKPTAGKVVFTISSKDKKQEEKTYTVNIRNTKQLIPDKKGYTLYAGTQNTCAITFGIPDGVELEEGPYVMVFSPLESVFASVEKMAAAEEVCDALMEGDTTVTDDHKWTITHYDNLNYLEKGTYNLYATLCKPEYEGYDLKFKMLTAPVKVTIKAVDAPKPTVKLQNKFKMSREEDASEELPFAQKDNCLEVKDMILKGNLDKGQPLYDITDYFDIYKEEDVWKIRTLRDVPEEITSLSGTVCYTVVGLDGITEVQIVDPITIELTSG